MSLDLLKMKAKLNTDTYYLLSGPKIIELVLFASVCYFTIATETRFSEGSLDVTALKISEKYKRLNKDDTITKCKVKISPLRSYISKRSSWQESTCHQTTIFSHTFSTPSTKTTNVSWIKLYNFHNLEIIVVDFGKRNKPRNQRNILSSARRNEQVRRTHIWQHIGQEKESRNEVM